MVFWGFFSMEVLYWALNKTHSLISKTLTTLPLHLSILYALLSSLYFDFIRLIHFLFLSNTFLFHFSYQQITLKQIKFLLFYYFFFRITQLRCLKGQVSRSIQLISSGTINRTHWQTHSNLLYIILAKS